MIVTHIRPRIIAEGKLPYKFTKDLISCMVQGHYAYIIVPWLEFIDKCFSELEYHYGIAQIPLHSHWDQ